MYKIDEIVDFMPYMVSTKSLYGRNIILDIFKCKNKTAVSWSDGKYIKDSGFLKKYFKNIYRTEGMKFFNEEIREVFQKIFDIDIPTEEQLLPLKLDLRKKHIAISILANDKKRIYPVEHWVKIINYILDRVDASTEIIFLGSGYKTENEFINKVISKLKYPEKCINTSGFFNPAGLMSILSHCKFLVSVETGTVHFAKSAGIRTICITNGQAYGNFLPYKDGVEYVYPDRFEERMKNPTYGFKLTAHQALNYDISISEIPPEKVIPLIDKYLKEEQLPIIEKQIEGQRLF